MAAAKQQTQQQQQRRRAERAAVQSGWCVESKATTTQPYIWVCASNEYVSVCVCSHLAHSQTNASSSSSSVVACNNNNNKHTSTVRATCKHYDYYKTARALHTRTRSCKITRAPRTGRVWCVWLCVCVCACYGYLYYYNTHTLHDRPTARRKY